LCTADELVDLIACLVVLPQELNSLLIASIRFRLFGHDASSSALACRKPSPLLQLICHPAQGMGGVLPRSAQVVIEGRTFGEGDPHIIEAPTGH
jgi:hypothetical protein